MAPTPPPRGAALACQFTSCLPLASVTLAPTLIDHMTPLFTKGNQIITDEIPKIRPRDAPLAVAYVVWCLQL